MKRAVLPLVRVVGCEGGKHVPIRLCFERLLGNNRGEMDKEKSRKPGSNEGNL